MSDDEKLAPDVGDNDVKNLIKKPTYKLYKESPPKGIDVKADF